MMKSSPEQLWLRYQEFYRHWPEIGLSMDLSRMDFKDGFFDHMEPAMQKAFAAMKALEAGAIANPDEQRMVGHYWLRNATLAPTPELSSAVTQALASVKRFASQVHAGELKGAHGVFTRLLVVGIGGSALGPQFVANALGDPLTDKLAVHFLDNTDPDGIDRVLGQLRTDLGRTLVVVISKSGGTKETRNGMLEVESAYRARGLKFGAHAVAVTGEGSALDRIAREGGWLEKFPMWDWVGGRTSELSAVGLLPAALQGLDIDGLLGGAAACDALTRCSETSKNPAALLSLMWFSATGGQGRKDMVILPYKDRLELFAKYLQQLIMESLGKEFDLDGVRVQQGIAVYGNKGSTDQHSYVQQLREGVNNFFVTFVEVLKHRSGPSQVWDRSAATGDYLMGFLLGTRQALYENGRESITLTIPEVTAFSVGCLIALYERAVGFYASLVNVNAYHQPGVEAGKKAAEAILDLEDRVIQSLRATPSTAYSAEELAHHLGAAASIETVFKICLHLAANPDRGVRKEGESPSSSRFGVC